MQTNPEHNDEVSSPVTIKKVALRIARHSVFQRLEWVLGIIVAMLIVYLHVIFLQNAGGFWRDEVSRIELATMPSLAEVWASLEYDAFPILSPLVIRLWTGTGLGETDFGLRLLGLMVGLSILGALWLNARSQGHSLPLLSMVLFGLSPLAIITGDAIGQYGLGILLNLLTFGLIWKVVDSPSPRRVFAASLAALLTAQCVYQSSFLILAFCLAGFSVTFFSGMWKRALLLAGIGMTAMLSLYPYLGIVNKSTSWGMLIQNRNTFKISWENLSRALGYPEHFMLWIWVGLFFLGTSISVYRIFQRSAETTKKEKDIAIFFTTAMVSSMVLFFLFFKVMEILPFPRYFLYPMAIAAVSLDAILGSRVSWSIWRTALTILILGLTFHSVSAEVHMRQTNIDLIASRMERAATKDDMILIIPWYCGISFQRYYNGDTAWMTLPPIEKLKIHRYDLLKERMISPDPIQPVLSKISDTLKSGNRVWLVWLTGTLPRFVNDRPPQPLPPAPHGPEGWSHEPYLKNWTRQVGYFIQTHALYHKTLPLSRNIAITPSEDLHIEVVSGWRSDSKNNII